MEKCLSNNMQEYEENPIFTQAALRAGTSALRAAISLAVSLSTGYVASVNRQSMEKPNVVSVQPVQVAQGRQANPQHSTPFEGRATPLKGRVESMKAAKEGTIFMMKKNGGYENPQQPTPFEGRVSQRLNTDHEKLEEPFDVSNESSNLRTEEFETMKKHEDDLKNELNENEEKDSTGPIREYNEEDSTGPTISYKNKDQSVRCNESTKGHDAMKEDFEETEQNTRHKYEAQSMEQTRYEQGPHRCAAIPGSRNGEASSVTPRSGKDVKEDDNDDYENYEKDMMKAWKSELSGENMRTMGGGVDVQRHYRQRCGTRSWRFGPRTRSKDV